MHHHLVSAVYLTVTLHLSPPDHVGARYLVKINGLSNFAPLNLCWSQIQVWSSTPLIKWIFYSQILFCFFSINFLNVCKRWLWIASDNLVPAGQYTCSGCVCWWIASNKLNTNWPIHLQRLCLLMDSLRQFQHQLVNTPAAVMFADAQQVLMVLLLQGSLLALL